MLKIGLTGGIGSGKTTICKVFQCLGIPVYSSDSESKKILDTDPDAKFELQKLFGKEVYHEEGYLNRKKLAQLVFGNPEALLKLNRLVHPLVRNHFLAWVKENKKAPYIIKEAAILIESGAYKDVDAILFVSSPEEKRITRVMERDQLDREAIEARIKQQLPEEEKMEMCDYVIYNDDLQMVIPQVIKLDQLFRSAL
jgi:dephospho-CoA kinase